MDSTVSVSDGNKGTRKKSRGITSIQRKKVIRYSNHFPNLENFVKPCNHPDRSLYKCNTITNEDIISARNKLYNKPLKTVQDTKLSHMISVRNPKRTNRQRKNKDARFQKHNVEIKYKLRAADRFVKVCKKFFLEALGISYRRILGIAKKVKIGEDLDEKRGGDHRSVKYKPKRDAVMKFIGNLRATESHYNRAKSKRLYLPSDLSISKLHKLYNKDATNSLHVNYAFFHNIFVTKFNIGFGSPASDICSLCVRLKNELKSETDNKRRTEIITNLRIHKLRAKQFTLLMNEELENAITFCFDMQQVQPLPKLAIGEAFYSRQFSVYNLCITDIKTRKPVFYTWCENLASRGSLEIGSALYHFLSEQTQDISDNCTIIKLFADGCAGQNKNNLVIHTLMKWLYNSPSSINQITLVFPVRGHSYLPADRVFGRVEKILRKKSEILSKEDYIQIYQEVGEVKELGKDWKLLNLQELTNYLKRVDGISQMKRFFIKKFISNGKIQVKLKTELFYRNDDLSKKFETFLKRGKNLFTPCLDIPLGKNIKKEKKQDVDNLLKSNFGEDWRNREDLNWYKKIIDEESFTIEEEKRYNEECECEEEDCGVRI